MQQTREKLGQQIGWLGGADIIGAGSTSEECLGPSCYDQYGGPSALEKRRESCQLWINS
jgi:hypothetical protein